MRAAPHPCVVIVKGQASTHSRRCDRFELTWFRYVDDDGDVRDVLHQQRRGADGRLHEADLPIDFGSTAAQTFDRYVELYRRVAGQADDMPAPGQLALPEMP